MDYLLRKSLMQKEPVEIIYMYNDGTFSKRTILVKEIVENHLNAYCLMKHQPRSFKMESILAVSQVKRKLEMGKLYA
jgi:predicted DNA-binding transcriptional regulator YafY